MLDLVQLARDADSLAAQARNRRCCDALRPCRSCASLRLGVRARRLILRCPRFPVALKSRKQPPAPALVELSLAS